MRQYRWRVAAGLAALLLAGACHNSGHNQNSTNMRSLNAVVDAEPLDFLVADDAKASALPRGSASSYSEFTAGARDVKIRSSTVQSVLAQKTLQFGDGLNSTVIAYGTRAATQILQIGDDTISPSSGHFKVRVLPFAANAAAIDFYATSGDISTVAPTLSGIGYSSPTDYTHVTPRPYRPLLTHTATNDI